MRQQGFVNYTTPSSYCLYIIHASNEIAIISISNVFSWIFFNKIITKKNPTIESISEQMTTSSTCRWWLASTRHDIFCRIVLSPITNMYFVRMVASVRIHNYQLPGNTTESRACLSCVIHVYVFSFVRTASLSALCIYSAARSSAQTKRKRLIIIRRRPQQPEPKMCTCVYSEFYWTVACLRYGNN